MIRRWWKKQRLKAMQRQLRQIIELEAKARMDVQFWHTKFDLLCYQRDELLEELDLTDEERKQMGLAHGNHTQSC